ncbi:MAG: prolipoprotein diacylglyceryl transferase [Azospirillaceae bacterium]|nr:prolipoprotein diacylglyceryl transferase [Azospirillaceae bacterium]
MLALAFPTLDPVAIAFGPIAIRWYALAYLAGFILGWRYCLHLTRRAGGRPNPADFDDFLTWAVLGVILGGRVGYVLFYQFDLYSHDPLEALRLWHGGMSFHGGMLGVVIAIVLFARQRRIDPFAVGDVVACAVPIGLFFGRIANFVNGELFGRFSDLPWAMVFPRGGPLPRHPSQLYEAAMEGLLLFVVLTVLVHRTRLRERPGCLCGLFLIGYGLCRIVGEFFREPDVQLGFLLGGATMGQLLSIPMVIGGAAILIWALRRHLATTTAIVRPPAP